MLLAAALAAIVIAPVPVTVHYGECPAAIGTAYGCYFPATNEMWVSDPADKGGYWHEMGHAFDAQRLDDGERNAFKCLPAMRVEYNTRGFKPCAAPWRGDVEEMFADAYANCKLRYVPSRGAFLTGAGYEPSTDRRHDNACRFIMRATRRCSPPREFGSGRCRATGARPDA